MNICLYSPYFPKHFGGGEKYLLDVATACVADGHRVSIAVTSREKSPEQIRSEYERFVNRSLSDVQFIFTPLNTSASFWQKLWWTKQFDVMYYETDGSLFFSLAKKNILHIQFPFSDKKDGVMERLKLVNWPIRNANSQFTQKHIEKNWGVSVPFVHYPIVEASALSLEKLLAGKEKMILNVGRFFQHTHAKRQDILVEIFKKMIDEEPEKMKGWKLVMIGAVEDEAYAQQVVVAAKNYPVEILHDVNRAELLKNYEKAAIYWHASGFGIDQEKEPLKVEHFGISTGEAMARACVPIVVGKGGQPEVVGTQLTDFLWQTPQDCMEKTLEIVQNKEGREKRARLAYEQAKKFSAEAFQQTLRTMLKK